MVMEDDGNVTVAISIGPDSLWVIMKECSEGHEYDELVSDHSTDTMDSISYHEV